MKYKNPVFNNLHRTRLNTHRKSKIIHHKSDTPGTSDINRLYEPNYQPKDKIFLPFGDSNVSVVHSLIRNVSLEISDFWPKSGRAIRLCCARISMTFFQLAASVRANSCCSFCLLARGLMIE